jgi:hypothetical protein
MSEFILAVDKVYFGDAGGTPANDLGKTKGGVIFRQNASSEVEIDNDQDVEPEAIITTKLRREMEINLADCTLDNLELLFNGTIGEVPNDNILTLPDEVDEGVTKSLKLVTKPLNGVKYEIELSRARIRPEGEINVNNDGNAVLTLVVVSLASESIKATLSLDNAVPDANSAVHFTAVEGGPDGNNITVTFVNAGVSQSLNVTVVGTDITVTLETDGSSIIQSTALEVAVAVNADVEANLLVSAIAAGNGSTVVEAHAETALSGGITYAAPKLTKVTV